MKKMEGSGTHGGRGHRLPAWHARSSRRAGPGNAPTRGASLWLPLLNTINAMIGGVRAGKYTRGGKRYDIRVRLATPIGEKPADIGKILFATTGANWCALSDVVAIREKPTLLTITRKNRERAIGIFANIAPGKSQARPWRSSIKRGRGPCPRATVWSFREALRRLRNPFQTVVRPGLGTLRGLHGARRPVQQFHPPVHGACWPCLSASRVRSSPSG
jgi:hypothetical protein